MSPTTCSIRSIKVLQINLRHARLATASFAQTLLETDVDVALVQEPYATCSSTSSPIIPFVPDSYEVFHMLNEDFLFGAAIVAKKSLQGRPFPEMASNHIAAALLELDGAPYLPPTLPSVP